MAATGEFMCPICRDVRRDIAAATPCNHQFCLGCIQRWAKLSATCPLCRVPMRTIKASVWGDKEHIEFIVSPPAAPVPANFLDGTAARAPPAVPLPPVQRGAGPQGWERPGGLLPQEWAALFREQSSILDPVLPSLHQKLSSTLGMTWWQVRLAESLFLCCLCHLGLDRDAMLQCIEPSVGSIAGPLIVWLIDTIVSRCGQEARRLRGLEDGGDDQGQEDIPAAPSPQRTLTPSTSTDLDTQEEVPGTSSGVSHGGDGELPSAPSPGEQEQAFEEPGQEAAGPSAQGFSRTRQRRESSSRRTRRPRRRRASSAQDGPQPCKRPPPRRL
ncbi:UNVERIFIED_CONTAM: hypothetical protein H355_004663 [Colinus virginianus]|nr:hypothetical protein H355_004663 [Colinus virginianus]